MWKPWGLGTSIDKMLRTQESKECRKRYLKRRNYLEDERRNEPDYIGDGHKYFTEKYKLLLEENSKQNNEIFRIMNYDNLEPEELENLVDDVTYTSHQLRKLCWKIQEKDENNKDYDPSIMREYESLRSYLFEKVWRLYTNFPLPQFPFIEPKGIKNPVIEDIEEGRTTYI